MRWYAKPLKKRPQHGSKRTLRRFALLPVRVDQEEEPASIVWLERYYVYQEATEGGYGGLQWHTLARYSKMPV